MQIIDTRKASSSPTLRSFLARNGFKLHVQSFFKIMPFSERSVSKIEIFSNGLIHCECLNTIYKDNVAVGSNKQKSCYFPGQDLSDAPEMVQKAASVFWTEDIIAGYKKYSVSIESADPASP